MRRRSFLRASSLYASVATSLALDACGGGSADGNANTNFAPLPAPLPAPAPGPVAPSIVISTGYTAPTALQLSQRLPASVYSTAATTPPALFDLSTSPFVPPVGNQGAQGCCTAWALGYAMAGFVCAKSRNLNARLAANEVSASDMYAKMLRYQQLFCQSGTSFDAANYVLVTQGVAPLSLVPYSDTACVVSSTDKTFGLSGLTTLLPTDRVGIQRAIADGNVLALGFNAYTDLQSFRGSSTYRRQVSSQLQGHAVTIVGYDNSLNAYRLMNSWGTSWGDAGFFWMDYGTFEQDGVEVAVPGTAGAAPSPAPAPSPPAPAPSPTPAPQTTLQILAANGQAYTTFGDANQHFKLNFQLSEPILLQSYSCGPGATPAFYSGVVNQWVQSSYIVLSQPNLFFSGPWTVTLQGTDSQGQFVRATFQFFAV
jgi:hypothetical protein